MQTITVLMSTYNGEKFLREQLDSILNQQLPLDFALKIIVRDDGSTDCTLDILKEYCDNTGNVVSYYTGENLRTARSFWHLLKNCPTSDYYAFADQDDCWYPDKISRAIATLQAEQNQDIPLLYNSNVMVADAELKPIAPMNADKLHTDLCHVILYNVSTGCTQVFNNAARDEFIKYDLDTGLQIMHDRIADLITVLFGKIIYDENTSMLYRQHGNNVVGEQSLGKVRSLFKRVKRFMGSSDSIRSDRARMLLDKYGDRLTDEQKHVLYVVGNYKTDKKARKELMKNKAFSRGKKSDFFFHWAVRLKKI
ncbi:MAG: glycosyltransferase family 2 protein [Clostridiales bacterium]|nr:glycosyltransferase family 2 protein [Clostridiales bacterium]